MFETRRLTRVVAFTAVALIAYGAGVLTGAFGSTGTAAPRGSAAAGGSASASLTGGSLGAGSSAGGAPTASASPGVLDQAAATIQRNAAKPISAADLDKAAVEGMLQALDDKWSSYMSPSDYASFESVIDGEYTGVGLWLRLDQSGAVNVVSVATGSPSDAAGMRTGDVVTAIGGKPVAGESLSQVVAALRGSDATTVKVSYRRGNATHTAALTRASVTNDDVTAKVTRSVMVITVRSFSKGVGAKVAKLDASARDRHLSGIVLDLRGNPGGLLDEAVKTASIFLDGGLVVTFEHRDAPPLQMDAGSGGDTGTPLAVLVDAGTASAAEVVTGALQDRGRAVVVGSRTFGKGSVQQPTVLPDGSAIEFTVGSYLTPAGRSLDGVGIEPDVDVPASAPPSVAEAQAIEVLSGLMADAGTGGHG